MKVSVPVRRAWSELSDKVPIIIVWVIKVFIAVCKRKKKFYVRKKNSTLKIQQK